MACDGWQVVPVGDLCVGVYDGPHATPKKTSSGPIFLGISNLIRGRIDLADAEHLSEEDFVTWTRRITPEPDDIVFSYETRLGEAAIIPNGLRCCLGRRMALMRPDRRRVVPRFLLYAFLSPDFQATLAARTVHGSTVDRIPLIEFPRFPVQVPPLSDQAAISSILGALDDKIDLNRRMNATLEALARALFRSWFVDFDPVRAKREGRRPPGLDAETAALFPSSFADSPLGPIPAGWRVSEIGEEVRAVGGSTPSTSEPVFWDGSINFATPKDLASLASPVLLSTERRITDLGLQKISSGLLPIGTVLLSSRAPIGYLAINEVPVAVNQGFVAMICDRSLPNLYVLHWAKQNTETIIGNANGTTFLEISKRNFRPIKVLVPDRPVLDRFIEIVGPVHKGIVSNLKEAGTLAALRDTLLPKLLSGEVRVGQAEDLVESRP